MTPPKNDAFLKHLRSIFEIEAGEHLDAMASLLLELERTESAQVRSGLVESLYREAHSLKGAARSVDQHRIEQSCKALENVLARLKKQEIQLSAPLFETLHGGLDELTRLLAGGAQDAGMAAGPEGAGASPAADDARTAAAPAPTAAAGETVRISTAKLEAILVQSEELVAFKFSLGHLNGELRALSARLADWQKHWRRSARDVHALRRLRDKQAAPALPGLDRMLDAFESEADFISSLADRLGRLQRQAEQERRALAGVADSLQEGMKEILVQPFSSLLDLWPKLVRDLARDSGKEVEWQVEGAGIEIDRRILEQMKDPLIHLTRNAIDHGIETPARRSQRGKPARGRFSVSISPRDGNRVEMLVSDDGAGIDLERLKASAVELGRMTPDNGDSLPADKLLELAFESGVTTSPIITDLSGRGLGLAIVREKVEKLGGSIRIERPDSGGTCFRILLPTALATFRGLVVALGERLFVLPSSSVERVARVAAVEVKTVENREAIEIDGEAVALVRLADVLGLPAPRPAGDKDQIPLAVLVGAGKRIAFGVDEVLGDQEVVVKGLGPQLHRVPHVAGATVLGAGRLVPVLNVPDLFVSALQVSPAMPLPAAPEAAVPEQRSILVAEDSITSRSLLKNILESAGFRVETAVDGMEALTALRAGHFDLLVSDVEMPRLDGFELTASLRQDKRLADLPVILVTALDSRQDKERGIEAGASAYIVKSSFDHGNLLEAIRRLV